MPQTHDQFEVVDDLCQTIDANYTLSIGLPKLHNEYGTLNALSPKLIMYSHYL